MLGIKRLWTVGACAAVFVMPGVAVAQRKPTYVERALIFYGMPKVDQARGPACYGMRVSTVNDRWATVWVQRRRHESVRHFVRRCNPGNGVSVMRKRHGSWRHAFDTEPGYKCHRQVPNGVGEDLRVDGSKLCSPDGWE